MNRLKLLVHKWKNLDPKKKAQYLAAVVLLAAVLAIYLSTVVPAAGQQTPKAEGGQEQDIESRLSAALSKVAGAGEVEVVIYYDSTPELIPATANDVQETTESQEGQTSQNRTEKTQIATAGQEALIIREDQPGIRGVIVVAKGADNIGVRVSLLNAVTTLLDIPSSKVEVLPM